MMLPFSVSSNMKGNNLLSSHLYRLIELVGFFSLKLSTLFLDTGYIIPSTFNLFSYRMSLLERLECCVYATG